jgi:type III secretion system YscD/HrpQ family protein
MSETTLPASPVEPAFAAASAHSHELRVLLGAQAGSRLPLRDGEYTLGSSDDGSIILVGPRIAPLHATLLVDGDTVQVRPEAGRVLDAQGRELGHAVPLAPGMPIELDGVWITVDRGEAAWPDVRDLAAVAATVDAPVGVPDAADVGVSPGLDGAVAPGRFGPLAALARQLRVPRRVGMALLAAAVLSSITAGAVAWWHDGPAVEGTPPDGASEAAVPASAPSDAASAVAPAASAVDAGPPAALVDLLQRLALDDVLTLTRQPDGAWRIAGYVPTATVKARLAKAVKDLQPLKGPNDAADKTQAVPEPLLQVFAQDDLIVAAQEALITADLPGGLRFAPASTGGTLKLVGGARSEAVADAAALVAIRRVPGLHQLESEVLLPEALLARLKDELTNAGLNRRITFTREVPEVVLSGKLVGDELARWQSLHQKFRADWGDALPIQANVDGTPPVLPFVVQAVVGGASPYLVTEDGTRVNRGGRIAGRTLTAIQNGELVFEGGERVRYTR